MTNTLLISHTLCVVVLSIYKDDLCTSCLYSVNGSLDSENVRLTFHDTMSEDRWRRHEAVRMSHTGSLHSLIKCIQEPAVMRRRSQTNTKQMTEIWLKTEHPCQVTPSGNNGVHQSSSKHISYTPPASHPAPPIWVKHTEKGLNELLLFIMTTNPPCWHNYWTKWLFSDYTSH